MKARHPVLILGSIALLAANSASTAESHRCAKVYADAERLSCYDAAYGKPVPPAPVAAAAATPKLVPVPEPVLPAAAKPAAEKKVKPAKEEKADSVRTTSTIAALDRLRDGRFQATLQNGEVWVESEPDSHFEVRVGEQVTIRPAMLGSFLLDAKNGSTRVRRGK
jgi:hypothetical protein